MHSLQARPSARPRAAAAPRPRLVAQPAPAPTASLRERLGYSRAELAAAAQVAFQHAQVGDWEAARAIFGGLAALEPRDGYFALGFGLALDRLGAVEEARREYRRAAELAPRDPRPDINLAELCLARGDRGGAVPLLQRALRKARAAGEPALEKKATSILTALGAASTTPRRARAGQPR